MQNLDVAKTVIAYSMGWALIALTRSWRPLRLRGSGTVRDDLSPVTGARAAKRPCPGRWHRPDPGSAGLTV